MAEPPEIIANEAAENQIQTGMAPANTSQKNIYPEVNERLKNLAVWFAVAFIVLAVVIQKYSGFF